MVSNYFYLDMKTHDLVVPYSGKNRRIRVLLPKNYDKRLDKTYPVVYFHDGQNVFYSKEAFSGHSWKVIPAIKRHPDLAQMIVVAIDNDGGNRMNEYSAWKYGHSIPGIQFGGLGSDYAEFVMEVVKPFIDTTYRTKPEREYTAMIGSSLGGNITQFMGIAYQEQIGALGVFSSANWLHQESFNRYLERQNLDGKQRVYIYVGTNEADEADQELTAKNVKQAYIDSSIHYYTRLIEKGYATTSLKLVVASDAEHSEEAWSKYMVDCFRFLSEDW